MRKFSVAQIEALLAIARFGTFHGAARHVNVTQPTISMRIRELEHAMGTTLFDRRGRKVVPTAEGDIAIRYAREAMGLFEELETRLRTSDPLHGSIRLGASEMLAMTCLPTIVAQMEAEIPSLRVELTVENSYVLGRKVANNLLDVAFLSRTAALGAITTWSLAHAPVAWVGSASRALPPDRLRPDDLEGVNIVSVAEGSPLFEIVQAWCSPHDGPARKFSTCNSTALIARLVTSGLAMSVLPLCILGDEIEAGRVLRYEQESGFAPLEVCVAFGRTIDPARFARVVDIARASMLGQPFYFPLG